jgi:hypothetical protein
LSLFRRVIRRTRQGRYQINLGADERSMLRALPADLRERLADPDDPGLRRLFPPAYGDDEQRAAEYRRLMQDDLVSRHRESLEVLERTADAEELSEEEMLAWLNALNQIRLVLGTRLDVSEDDDLSARPQTPEEAVYLFLGALQELVVDALSG